MGDEPRMQMSLISNFVIDSSKTRTSFRIDKYARGVLVGE